jgi:hypothetical protein
MGQVPQNVVGISKQQQLDSAGAQGAHVGRKSSDDAFAPSPVFFIHVVWQAPHRRWRLFMFPVTPSMFQKLERSAFGKGQQHAGVNNTTAAAGALIEVFQSDLGEAFLALRYARLSKAVPVLPWHFQVL